MLRTLMHLLTPGRPQPRAFTLSFQACISFCLTVKVIIPSHPLQMCS